MSDSCARPTTCSSQRIPSGRSSFTVCRSCKAVRCCPQQRDHHIHNMLHLPFPVHPRGPLLLYQVTDMVACPVLAVTRFICRTTVGRQHHGRGLHHRISANRAQPPNRSRPVSISLPRTRRCKRIRQRVLRDQLSITSTLRRAVANMLCTIRLAWSDLLSHSRHPPLSHTLRPQMIHIIDATPGCVPSGRPNVPTRLHLQIKSRPGPNSGVGHRLTAFLVFLHCQVSHSVRVPALSLELGKAAFLPISKDSKCPSQTQFRSQLGSRTLLTTGTDMSRDLLTEHVTELFDKDKRTIKVAPSQLPTLRSIHSP